MFWIVLVIGGFLSNIGTTSYPVASFHTLEACQASIADNFAPRREGSDTHLTCVFSETEPRTVAPIGAD